MFVEIFIANAHLPREMNTHLHITMLQNHVPAVGVGNPYFFYATNHEMPVLSF